MIRYLITPGDAGDDERRWLLRVGKWIERGVDFVQIRERNLTARHLAELTRKVIHVRGAARAKILVNDRADVAIACGADGVHIRDHSAFLHVPGPENFSQALRPPTGGRARSERPWIVSAACHGADRVSALARADLILLSPIFAPISKESGLTPLGAEAISRAAALTRTPILALGGVTRANQSTCIREGAAGIAGIGYFE